MNAPLRSEGREYAISAAYAFEQALSRLVAEHRWSGGEAERALGDPRSFAERALRASAPVASPWDDLVGPFVRSDGVRARLGITRQAVAAKAGRRRLLRTITADGEHLYPIWQFDGDRLVDGLADVLALFPEQSVDGWTLAGWLRSRDPDLGEPPLDALLHGGLDRVRAVARTAARALAA